MYYHFEHWVMKKHVDRISGVKMRMLRRMSCKTRKDIMINEDIRDFLGVLLVEES